MNARTFSLPTTEAAYCSEFARFISPLLKISYQPCRVLKRIVIHFNSWIWVNPWSEGRTSSTQRTLATVRLVDAVTSNWRGPLEFSSGEPMLVPDQPKLRLIHHSREKRLAFAHPSCKFLARVEGGIDRPTEIAGGLLKGRENLGIRQAVAHNLRTGTCLGRWPALQRIESKRRQPPKGDQYCTPVHSTGHSRHPVFWLRRLSASALHDPIERGKVRAIARFGEKCSGVHGRKLLRHRGGDKLVDAGAIGLGTAHDFGFH
jgi:hypothetical protein